MKGRISRAPGIFNNPPSVAPVHVVVRTHAIDTEHCYGGVLVRNCSKPTQSVPALVDNALLERRAFGLKLSKTAWRRSWQPGAGGNNLWQCPLLFRQIWPRPSTLLPSITLPLARELCLRQPGTCIEHHLRCVSPIQRDFQMFVRATAGARR